VVGLHWGAYVQHQPERIPEVFEALRRLHAEGAVKPVIFRRYPLAETGKALRDLASRRTWGKVIVAP